MSERLEQDGVVTFVKGGAVERFISKVAPGFGLRRMRDRFAMALAGGYSGASLSKASLRNWRTPTLDADSILQYDLETLRNRSQDLERNNPLALGAVNTKDTCVVGAGIRMHPRIDRDVLNLTDEQADAWEAATQREWRLFFETAECDAARTLNGYGLQRQVYRRRLVDGDVLVLLPYIERPGSPYGLKQRVVEGARLCNPQFKPDTDTLSGGVEKDENGAPKTYHITKRHPGNIRGGARNEWISVPAFGEKSGRRNALHVFRQNRPGQSRGVPDLAPIIDILKQLGRLTEAEVDAAVINSFFTVFFTSNLGSDDTFKSVMGGTQTNTTSSSTEPMELGPGAMFQAPPGTDVKFADPKRPNDKFDAFVTALLRQIGVGLEIPFEILVKHFTSSYSASRAALLEAWRFFLAERKWFVDCYLQPLYEAFMDEAVALGRIHAPGYFKDPIIRQGYLGAEWVGPTKGMIDELKEVLAAEKRMEIGLSTLESETAQLTGGDWESNHRQQVKERKARLEGGLIADPTALDAGSISQGRTDDRDALYAIAYGGGKN